MLDPNSSVSTDNISTIAIAEMQNANRQSNRESTIAIADLKTNDSIDIYHNLQIPDIKEFPVEDFFRLPFSHHIRIIEGTKDVFARYHYIHRAVEENIPSDKLAEYMKKDACSSKQNIPSNFTQTLPNASLARKAVMMFKDEYLLDFINVEQSALCCANRLIGIMWNLLSVTTINQWVWPLINPLRKCPKT